MAAHASARIGRAALLHGIYAILNEDSTALENARGLLEAGIKIVQYRAKRGIVEKSVRRLREMTRERGALLILNDDWRASLEYDCDGVHLGPGDAGFDDVAPLRAALPAQLIGLSCGTAEELERAGAADVDYVGIGSVYATSSKPDAGAPIGTAGLRALAAHTRLPIAAVGGITLAMLPEVREAGVAMAAVISAIDGAAPDRAARELVARWG